MVPSTFGSDWVALVAKLCHRTIRYDSTKWGRIIVSLTPRGPTRAKTRLFPPFILLCLTFASHAVTT